MSVRKAGKVIAGTPKITPGRHVGEIFWTSRLDNELNGAVDAKGATYSVEAFTGEKSVPELLRKGSLPYVSMAEYERIVSTYGSCRAWGWDGGDKFRVPTLKDVYLTEGQAETAVRYRAMVQVATSVQEVATSVQEDATQLKEYKFNNPHFFGESKWTDVEPNNASWLLSNGNFHSGRTYVDYYKWLVGHIGETITANGGKIVTTNDKYTDYDWVINTVDETLRLPFETSSNGLKSYFYVGDTVQDARLINVGEVLDYFSNIDTVHCVVETFKSGSSWYRVYDDGWVEQGATIPLTACPQTITLLKQYQDTNYTICIGGGDPDSNASVCATAVYPRAVGSFSLVSGYNGAFYACVMSWMACGYGA
jgi:hypothetical protein